MISSRPSLTIHAHVLFAFQFKYYATLPTVGGGGDGVACTVCLFATHTVSVSSTKFAYNCVCSCCAISQSLKRHVFFHVSRTVETTVSQANTNLYSGNKKTKFHLGFIFRFDFFFRFRLERRTRSQLDKTQFDVMDFLPKQHIE